MLDHVKNSLCEVEFDQAQNEHKESFVVRFFLLQKAKLEKLELYYSFITNFCVVHKFQELERESESLYIALTWKIV